MGWDAERGLDVGDMLGCLLNWQRENTRPQAQQLR
jgi:hypothetical protein